MIVDWDKVKFDKPQGFFVLEGLNGSGKSTLSSFLCESIRANNRIACRTFEPGATELGKNIRQIVLGQTSEEKSLTPLAELLLFTADRNLHVEKVIKPALVNNEIVICDRFFYSTLAFQGYGRGFPLDQIEMLTKLAIKDLRPDVVLLLDLPPELGLARTKGRSPSDSSSQDSFESEELSFHTRLREGFLTIAAQRPEQFVILDATQSIETIKKQGLFILKELFNALGRDGLSPTC